MTAKSKSVGRVARAELRTSAPPEAAYAAWADPARLAQWFVDRARGEARPGGSMTWVWDAFGMEVEYRVLEADPPRRLVLGTGGEHAPPGIIEITIARAGGETILTVVNSGFGEGPEADEIYEGVRSGWILALAMLRVYLERYDGRPKRSFMHMLPAPVDDAHMVTWFTAPDRLARWLTTSGAPDPDRPTTLVLRDGWTVEARVLARTDRELSLLLPDQDTVLELKSFATGFLPDHDAGHPRATRMVALRATSWAPDASPLARLRAVAEDALPALLRALRDSA